MLSRTADSLYWLSRYIERAENLARILDVAQRLATLPSAYAGVSSEWESAIATAACSEAFYNSYDKATRQNVVEFIVASDANSSSIRRCVETARANARAVRTALTTEMWEIINGLWHEVQKFKLKNIEPSQLSRFLAVVQEASLRFDGTAYRTMLRTDHFRFQRIGTFIERADNIARLLDVKYHVLLPEQEPVGGGLDYFQWSAILRSVGALTSYNWVYRDNVKPWLVADFLILRLEQPRSLISSYENLNRQLDAVAEKYGRQGAPQRIARATFAKLQNQNIDELFQS
ncbi:MAG: alpha-E domain-containing protein, partial [Beijerinckiaceae bacterium]